MTVTAVAIGHHKGPLTVAAEIADAIPTPVVFALTFAMPWWREWLLSVSEWATVAGQIAAVALAVYKVHDAMQAGKGSGDTAVSAAGALSVAAKSGAKASPGLIVAALTAIGAMALVSYFTSNRASAAPAMLTSGPAVGARKRRSDDDAGDSGTVEADENTSDAPAYFLTARSMIGTEEATGRRSNPIVSEMYASVGMSPKTDARKVPWCAVFVNWCLDQNGLIGTGSAMARSFLKWGEPVTQPRQGDVVVFWRGKYDDHESGHVGFVDRIAGDYVYVLGGNQSDSVCVSRFSRGRVLGFRRPRKASSLRTAQAAAGSAATGTAGEAINQAAPTPEKAQELVAAIEPVKGPLSEMAVWLPIAGKLLTCLCIALAIYAVYCRVRDFKQRGI